jgi:hypothetical protein
VVFDRRGLWQTTIEASDTTGAVVGSFAARSLRRGGSLCWGDRDFELRPASMWTERYALSDQDRELAVLDDGKPNNRRPASRSTRSQINALEREPAEVQPKPGGDEQLY